MNTNQQQNERMIVYRNSRSVFECLLCHQLLDGPRSLPCLHAFCLKCLELHYDKPNADRSAAKCPECLRPFQVPDCGLAGIRIDPFLQRLVAQRRRIVSGGISTDYVPCQGVCAEQASDDQIRSSAATRFCVTCRENLCKRCAIVHSRWTASVQHRVLALGSEELLEAESGKYCDRHRENVSEFHCTICRKNVCRSCREEEDHADHDCKGIDSVADLLRVATLENAGMISRQIDELMGRIANLGQNGGCVLRRLRSNVEKAEKDIIAAGEALRLKVDTRVQELLRELKSKEQRIAGTIDKTRQAFQSTVECLENFRAYSSELIEGGKPWELASADRGLRERADELQTTFSGLDGSFELPSLAFRTADVARSPDFSIGFITEDQPTQSHVISDVRSTRTTQVIGTVSVKADTTSTSSSSPSDIRGSLSTSSVASEGLSSATEPVYFAEGESIWGLAVLGDIIYILRDRSRFEIDVYDINTHDRIDQLTVPGLRAMSDMSSCPTNHCLYIADTKIVNRLDVTKEIPPMHWDVDEKIEALSVTTSATVLVIFANATSRNNSVSRIGEFTADGVKVRMYPFDEITDVRHAVKNSQGQFVVASTTRNRHSVSLIDDVGHVLNAYSGETENDEAMDDPESTLIENRRLNFPCHLAIDPSDESIFIVDRDNGRVLRLDGRNFKTIREFAAFDKKEKVRPCKLCLRSSGATRQLFVAINKWGARKVATGPRVGKLLVQQISD